MAVPNGVDSDHFLPAEGPEADHSCVFWGRLDFGPNIQAIQWFCNRVWPAVRRQVSDATFTIIGFNPTDPIRGSLDARGSLCYRTCLISEMRSGDMRWLSYRSSAVAVSRTSCSRQRPWLGPSW